MLLENGDILAGYLERPADLPLQHRVEHLDGDGDQEQRRPERRGGLDQAARRQHLVLRHLLQHRQHARPGAALHPLDRAWVNTGPVPVALSNTAEYELGPMRVAAQRRRDPDRRSDHGNTAIFNPSTDTNTGGGTWTAGPVIPGGYVSDDAPGVLLPNGQFIFTADQPDYNTPTHVFDYNYTQQHDHRHHSDRRQWRPCGPRGPTGRRRRRTPIAS